MPSDAPTSVASAAPPGLSEPDVSHAVVREPTPLSASDTHGKHFSYLANHMTTVCLASTAVIVAFVAGFQVSGPLAGIGAAAIVVLGCAIAIWAVARGRAAEDFFDAYAEGRNLTRYAKGLLPPVTPLLRKGDRRKATQIMFGTLPGGLEGKLAHYTYEVDTRDSDGDTDTKRYEFTVVVGEVPELAPFSSGLYCQPRVAFRFLDSAADQFRRARRLELESEVFDKRFEVFFDDHDSENWHKQLFSPSFIVWMAEQAPDGFGFEAVAGALCFFRKGHLDEAAELDALCDAAALTAKRLRDEANE